MSNPNLYSLPSLRYPIVTLQNLKFSYNGRNILSIPHWELMHGESIFISGESGSGKTTLVSILSGLIRPDKGIIEINTRDISVMRPKELNTFRANNIGLISQQFNLIPYLKVIDNILLAHYFSKNKKAEIKTEAITLMDKLHLKEEVAEQKAFELSVGQQQRVAIVRALINRPSLLIADEPTSALDSFAKNRFIDMLNEIMDQINLSLILISHDESLKTHFNRTTTLSKLQSNAF
ncbi:ABC transporter ATP-binding protein [Marinicella sp. W31]|uniref:ABC transporter ATP-binding protein n=1 Tax=Marinicella sp. W31 TaxID=3023713 RepID=UPI003756BDD6